VNHEEGEYQARHLGSRGDEVAYQVPSLQAGSTHRGRRQHNLLGDAGPGTLDASKQAYACPDAAQSQLSEHRLGTTQMQNHSRSAPGPSSLR
jgi:hypothetical protein